MARSLAEAALAAAASLKKTRSNLVSSYRDTLEDVGSSLVFFTPLKTGLASSNWGVSNSGTKSVERKVAKGVKGKASIDAIRLQVPNIDYSKAAIFNNPVDYIPDLEDGSSPQARAGMITPTRSRVSDLWLKNLRKYKII